MIEQGTSYVVKAELSPLSPLLSSDHPACGGEVLSDGVCPLFTRSYPPSCAGPSSAPLPRSHGELRRLTKAPHPAHILRCPRCDSSDTKFCYYNNYNLSQPRYFCRNCKRYWTAGGALRNVPVGGGLRKNKRFKLRLQAEAEAAASAIAASSGATLDESSQLQHYYDDGKPPSSPVPAASSSAAAAVGMSSSTTGNSSVISGINPANFIAAAPLPSFHSSHTTHLSTRTRSVSDGSTVDYAGNDCSCSSTAAVAALQLTEYRSQQHCGNNNQLQDFFGELCEHAALTGTPKLYPSYSTSSDASNLQQHSIKAAGSRLNDQKPSYQAMGYAQYQLVHGNGVEQARYRAVISGNGGRDVSSNDHLQQTEELISNNPHYNWQFIPDNLFNGSASEGFLLQPGGSWPEFLQFQDPSAPV